MEPEHSCPSLLQTALVSMLSTFLSKRGENGKISRDGFLQLLKEQLPGFPEANADELFKCVDENDDKLMDFGEFARLFVVFACINYEEIEKLLSPEKKPDDCAEK